jgi:hypothetical protein
MKPTFKFLYLDEGTDFESQELYWTDKDDNPVDLTTYVLTAKMKKHADAIEALSPAIPMTVAVVDPLMGEYQLTLPATQVVDHHTYIFEVIATKGGKKTKIAEGQVVVRPGV